MSDTHTLVVHVPRRQETVERNIRRGKSAVHCVAVSTREGLGTTATLTVDRFESRVSQNLLLGPGAPVVERGVLGYRLAQGQLATVKQRLDLRQPLILRLGVLEGRLCVRA